MSIAFMDVKLNASSFLYHLMNNFVAVKIKENLKMPRDKVCQFVTNNIDFHFIK